MMKLSQLEQRAYDYLSAAPRSTVGIDELIAACYKGEQKPPYNARRSLTTVLRSLMDKALLMKLPYQIERVSPIGPHVGQYRAIRKDQRPHTAGSKRKAR